MNALEFGGRKLGFGCMRLPLSEGNLDDGVVDSAQMCQMVDEFLAQGFRYFDTAHGYIHGKSETALRECLTSRHPRGSYILTDKLTDSFFEREEDIRPLFQKQLDAVGVDYFDFYLIHSVTAERYRKYVDCNAFEVVRQLKTEGKVRHFGISFHDKPELLEQILTEQPDIEVVQIQFNYMDYNDSGVQSRGVYEVCRKFGKPVLVMEPVRGGGLANLPEEAAAPFRELGDSSPASYAIRFAASQEGVAVVLSGMSDLEQLRDNMSYMKEFRPLDERERTAVDRVREALQKEDLIRCTGCRYCVAGCPQHILIPDLFACMNAKKRYNNWNSDFYYGISTQGDHGKAGDCIGCGRCEQTCPQHLPVTELLKTVAETFEKKTAE